jgi:hypothetical protein
MQMRCDRGKAAVIAGPPSCIAFPVMLVKQSKAWGCEALLVSIPGILQSLPVQVNRLVGQHHEPAWRMCGNKCGTSGYKSSNGG